MPETFQPNPNYGVYSQVEKEDPNGDVVGMNEGDHESLREESKYEVFMEIEKIFEVCVENEIMSNSQKKSEDSVEAKKLETSGERKEKTIKKTEIKEKKNYCGKKYSCEKNHRSIFPTNVVSYYFPCALYGSITTVENQV